MIFQCQIWRKWLAYVEVVGFEIGDGGNKNPWASKVWFPWSFLFHFYAFGLDDLWSFSLTHNLFLLVYLIATEKREEREKASGGSPRKEKERDMRTEYVERGALKKKHEEKLREGGEKMQEA